MNLAREPEKYRVRLRVRLAKAFSTSALTRTLAVAGRNVTILSQERDQALSETRWIILRASGFPSEQEAREFGRWLREIAELAGLCSRLGIDVGVDQPTGSMSEEFARAQGLIAPDERLLPNVHGLAVLPDDEKNRIPIVKVEATVRADLDQFSSALIELGAGPRLQLGSAAVGVRILNLALTNPEPLAQVVLALSAIEGFGQSETWTKNQVALIDDLAKQVESAVEGADAERQEVADGLRRSLHRIGLRQGVMRMLDRLELQSLRREWDRIYGVRSGIFHGTARLTNSEVAQLALDAITLCGRIVLVAAQRNGMTLPSVCAVHFPASMRD